MISYSSNAKPRCAQYGTMHTRDSIDLSKQTMENKLCRLDLPVCQSKHQNACGHSGIVRRKFWFWQNSQEIIDFWYRNKRSFQEVSGRMITGKMLVLRMLFEQKICQYLYQILFPSLPALKEIIAFRDMEHPKNPSSIVRTVQFSFPHFQRSKDQARHLVFNHFVFYFIGVLLQWKTAKNFFVKVRK